jgi:hypothetical protein
MQLLESVEQIPDPRNPKGVRHGITPLLKATLIGLLAGMTCIEHIAQYIQEQWEQLADFLGFTHYHPPHAETYRFVLNRIDCQTLSHAFEKWISEWLKDRTFDIAVDGKACCGIQTGEDPRDVLMVLNGFVHDLQVVISQWRIPDKKGEPTVLKEQLAELVEKYPGIRLLTGDAYFSGRNLCEAITQLHKDYLVRIKGNQKDIEEALSFWFDQHLKPKPNKAPVKPDASHQEKKGLQSSLASCI